jgi:hypothetical protein
VPVAGRRGVNVVMHFADCVRSRSRQKAVQHGRAEDYRF